MKVSKFRNALVVLASLGCALSMSAANASSLDIGSGWVSFSFGGVGSSFSGEPFTFTLSSGGTLRVTDAFLAGDRFEIFDSLISLGQTSAPASLGDFTESFDGAFADPRWSSGSYALSAGYHSISGIVTASPFGAGGAALRVDTVSPVPEPASWAMSGAGLLLLAWMRRRKI